MDLAIPDCRRLLTPGSGEQGRPTGHSFGDVFLLGEGWQAPEVLERQDAGAKLPGHRFPI